MLKSLKTFLSSMSGKKCIKIHLYDIEDQKLKSITNFSQLSN